MPYSETTPLTRIQDFLACKRFAFIGVSRRSNDFSRALFREFLQRGYDAVPVHPVATELEGVPCYAHLSDIQPPLDSALLMTSPTLTGDLVQECARAGIQRIWLYRGAGQGAVTATAIQLCEANGISVIPGECPFMFFPDTGWIHRAHGFVKHILGTYPK